MKYFIVADVHGFFDEMMQALNRAGFDRDDPTHIFVSLGDLLDRGTQPEECLNFVNGLARKILIRGNHEDLIEALLARRDAIARDHRNGTFDTAIKLNGGYPVDYAAMQEHPALQTYLRSTVDYHETKTAVFVHGWLPCFVDQRYDEGVTVTSYEKRPDWRDLPPECQAWKDARWYNGMEAWHCGATEPKKTVFCGHRHCSWGHFMYGDAPDEAADFSPFIRDGIVALDACTAYSHQMNCCVLEENNGVE